MYSLLEYYVYSNGLLCILYMNIVCILMILFISMYSLHEYSMYFNDLLCIPYMNILCILMIYYVFLM